MLAGGWNKWFDVEVLWTAYKRMTILGNHTSCWNNMCLFTNNSTTINNKMHQSLNQSDLSKLHIVCTVNYEYSLFSHLYKSLVYTKHLTVQLICTKYSFFKLSNNNRMQSATTPSSSLTSLYKSEFKLNLSAVKINNIKKGREFSTF